MSKVVVVMGTCRRRPHRRPASWAAQGYDAGLIACGVAGLGQLREPGNERQGELAFGASVVEREGLLDLCYSVGDTDPARATLGWRA